MYKQITSNKGGGDLFIGFDRDRNRRRDELNNNKNVEGNKNPHRIMLKDILDLQNTRKNYLWFKLLIKTNKKYR